jgi:hypothetical protein
VCVCQQPSPRRATHAQLGGRAAASKGTTGSGRAKDRRGHSTPGRDSAEAVVLLAWVLACDSYEQRDDGTTDIYGAGIDTAYVDRLPARVELTLLARVWLTEKETGEIDVRCSVRTRRRSNADARDRTGP